MDAKDIQRRALSKRAAKQVAKYERYFMAERPAFAAHSTRSVRARSEWRALNGS
jgi:hypothetical protein